MFSSQDLEVSKGTNVITWALPMPSVHSVWESSIKDKAVEEGRLCGSDASWVEAT